MHRLRNIIKRILPAWWIDRIDIEGAGIRAHIRKSANCLQPGLRILDAGAGETPYRKYFQDHRYFSIDFAKGEQAWNYCCVDVIGRLEELPFREASFDCVVSTQVIEHVSEPLQVLIDAHRVLKSGGCLLLTAPLGFGEHQQPYDFFRYTRFGLRYLLEKAGFKDICIEPRGGYFKYLAVMSMWIYIYLFPDDRKTATKIMWMPLQCIAAVFFIILLPPLISIFDFIDREKSITLGFAVTAKKE